MLFYERAWTDGNLSVFDKFLNSDDIYDQEWTKESHIVDIINYERKWTTLMDDFARKFDYYLDLDSDYFLGFGGTAIAFRVSKDGVDYAMKLIWGYGNANLYSQSIANQNLIKDAGLEHYVPRLYLSAFIDDPDTVTAFNSIAFAPDIGLIEEPDVTKHQYGVLIMEYVGEALSRFNPSSFKSLVKQQICKDLRQIKQALIEKGLAHEDLHHDNIMVYVERSKIRVKIIDLEEIKPYRTAQQFEKVNDVLRDWC